MANDNEAVILSAARTPIGKFQGSLSSVPATQLGAIAVKAAVERAGIHPEDIEEVIMGNVVQAGEGQAPARQSGILSGIPATVSASTVNKVCGSGLKAAMFASQAIRAGGFLFVSGQAGVGDDGAIVGNGDFDRQADQAFRNLQRAVTAGGSSMERIIKVTIFLTSMTYFSKIVELRRKWFSAPYPADTIVEVSALYSPDAMIEIEAIAAVEGDAA